MGRTQLSKPTRIRYKKIEKALADEGPQDLEEIDEVFD